MHEQVRVAAGVGRGAQVEAPAATRWFEWGMAALSAALVGGLYLDGWAHTHGRADTTFFTPWHGVLYSALAAVALLLGETYRRNLLRGHHWRRALPEGYGLSLAGALLFAAGGAADLAWHTRFGIERGLEALLSPPHLLLALAGVLIVSGPLRAPARAAGGWGAQTPVVVAIVAVLSVLAFFTEYAHPFVHPVGIRYGDRELGVASVMLQSALLMGVVLRGLARGPLPPGTMTVVLTSNTALVSIFNDLYALILIGALAGLVCDGLLLALRPAVDRAAALRVFAAAVPVVLYGLYFSALALRGALEWSVHLWAGAVFLAGAAGLLLSALVTAGGADQAAPTRPAA